jgi:tungstate transport system substrate-binding protein
MATTRAKASRRSLLLALFPAALGAAACRDPGSSKERASRSAPSTATSANRDVILATTTSTQDSGLLDVLLPEFQRGSGYRVKTIAVGSGRAIAMGERGEADVLLTHAPEAERELVGRGAVVARRLVMHNDFVLLGPLADPARVRGLTAVEALAAIQGRGSPFLSRGDDSGTHKVEKKLWKRAGREPTGSWYQESGSGMGETLTIANEKGAYTLSDRATYLAHRRSLSLVVLVEGGGELMNLYHVMLVRPDRFAKVNRAGAGAFADFLLSEPAQRTIASFGRDRHGEPLFHADGGRTEEQVAGSR